ncbi:hypothetical protein [Gimesia sp.]|uniref:hypothetical protein n=1 Tax=Gimesia sp. TaxID=2024833 RepID=UPI000C47DD88|nr:hypothetical protein [Gimesia sp.]MAX40902.1 hypothetical protein [Gimesia sp.]HBL44487.1 hypothetical protein [Planctomycetaceae bacterium]
MSLQILQKPQRPVAEETITVEPRFERVENQPEREVSRQLTAAWDSCPAPAKLESEIHSGTHHQVQNVKVRCDHAGITVYGVSSSYYLKQLVTQTVQTFAPSIPLMNRVLVQAK